MEICKGKGEKWRLLNSLQGKGCQKQVRVICPFSCCLQRGIEENRILSSTKVNNNHPNNFGDQHILVSEFAKPVTSTQPYNIHFPAATKQQFQNDRTKCYGEENSA